MSNVLAGIGRAQLASLPSKVASCQLLFARYQDALGDLPGIGFIPANPKDIPNRWLSCITIDPEATNSTPEQLRLVFGRSQCRVSASLEAYAPTTPICWSRMLRRRCFWKSCSGLVFACRQVLRLLMHNLLLWRKLCVLTGNESFNPDIFLSIEDDWRASHLFFAIVHFILARL